MIRATLYWRGEAEFVRILACQQGIRVAFQEIGVDRDVLLHQMTDRFQELYNQALDALDRAPDGQWIAASERVFLDVFRQLMTESYQAAMQTKVDAHPTAQSAAFSPCEPGDRRSASPASQG